MPKPAYAVYLLESEWSYDHYNREFATITIEGIEGHRYELPFEEIMNPQCDRDFRERTLGTLLGVARGQNRNIGMESPRLLRLYRIVDREGIILEPPVKGESLMLNMKLELICEFDRHNNPILAPATESLSVH